MIRFSCPHCHRTYVLPEVLARVPLLCKGCGQRLSTAGAETVEFDEPAPPPPEVPPPVESEVKKVVADVPDEVATKPSPAPADAPRERRALGVVVDVAVGLALAGGGALLGEFAVRKPSAEVVRGAAPMDLLVWGGCVATPLLVYALLANRGKTVGGWLRRRG